LNINGLLCVVKSDVNANVLRLVFDV